MKHIHALVLTMICATAMTIACQKGGGGSSDPSVQSYVFTGQQDILNGTYSYNGYFRNAVNNTTTNQTCSTGNVTFGTRTQFCAVIRDEVRNNNCAYEQRQNMFQQYCVNANTSTVGFNPTTIGGSIPTVPVNPKTPNVGGGLGAGNSKLVTCTLVREKNGSILVSSKSSVQTKIWNTSESASMTFSKGLFANNGEAKINLVPKSGTEHARIQILFSKKSDSDKTQSKTASVEAGIHAVVYLTVSDEEDQRESTISCSVTNGQSATVAAGKTLNCEGAGITASGEKFQISQNYPWNGKNILETIALGKENSSDLILSAIPGISGQPAHISIEIPHGDHDLDYKAQGALTNSTSTFEQKEQNSGFRINLKCTLLP